MHCEGEMMSRPSWCQRPVEETLRELKEIGLKLALKGSA
jgi:hypothetical protein